MATKEINLIFNNAEARINYQELVAFSKYTPVSASINYNPIVTDNSLILTNLIVNAPKVTNAFIPGQYSRAISNVKIYDFINTQSGFGVSFTSNGLFIDFVIKDTSSFYYSTTSNQSFISSLIFNKTFDVSSIVSNSIIDVGLDITVDTDSILTVNVPYKLINIDYSSNVNLSSYITNFDRSRLLDSYILVLDTEITKTINNAIISTNISNSEIFKNTDTLLATTVINPQTQLIFSNSAILNSTSSTTSSIFSVDWLSELLETFSSSSEITSTFINKQDTSVIISNSLFDYTAARASTFISSSTISDLLFIDASIYLNVSNIISSSNIISFDRGKEIDSSAFIFSLTYNLTNKSIEVDTTISNSLFTYTAARAAILASNIIVLDSAFAVQHDYFADPTYTLDLTYVGSVFIF